MPLLLLVLLALPAWGRFALTGPSGSAMVCVAEGEEGMVQRAAQDLIADVRKITGRTLALSGTSKGCRPPALQIRTVQDGRWEAYRLRETKSGLLIQGSDSRGTMFGVYAFLERYVGVDPLYFWTGREPLQRSSLQWDRIQLESGEPDFRYRGWFINDEDLLTEWRSGGGTRDIDYPFYHQVAHPDVMERVFEAAVRLGYNLIIPASFTDIANPAEERLVQAASARGLMVSMHHVEPMGVSAFAFARYFKERNRHVPYSFHSHRAEFEEVWRWYAAKWARYPGVIWQLGLRGIADRPAWYHDPAAPKTDEARAAMISEAMELQHRIIRSLDKRTDPPMTTTLWMEGADFNRRGLLKIPKGVTVVFADNTPGWKMQQDFHTLPRQPGRTYGIYYHHAVWGWGPHLVQAVAPWKTEEIMRQAVAKRSAHYAILNVANVREFALGLAASARMLRRMEGFNGHEFLKEWCEQRFAPAAPAAVQAYRKLFDSYLEDPDIGTPALLDGTTLAQGKRLMERLLRRSEGKADAVEAPKPERAAENLGRFLPNMPNPGAYPLEKLAALSARQRALVDEAGAVGETVLPRLSGNERDFFAANFLAQQRILAGLLGWLEHAARANLASDRSEMQAHARLARDAFAKVREGQSLASQGGWQEWYRGDRKMNLDSAEKLTIRAVTAVTGAAN